MSHATIAMTPASQVILSAMMPAVAVGAAGFAVTAGAIAAAKKLRGDFECAKAEFEERCRQDEAADLAIADRQALMAMSASMLGASIEAGSENTTLAFLDRSISGLATRATEANQEEIAARATALAETLTVDSATAILKAYFALCDELDAATASQPEAKGTEFELLKAEIESLAASGIGNERLRSEFNEQFAKLEAAAAKGGSVARQGVANLRSRVRREIADHSERAERMVAERQQKREIVAEAYAMIRAVLSASNDLDEQSQAQRLLTQLGGAFQKGAPPAVSELEALLAKARNLFGKCEKRLEDAAAHAYVADSVRDVLLNLGYQVSEVPSELATTDPGYMVSIDSDSGVVVSVAPDGKMLTEMVAFNANGVDPDEEDEKKVCGVVDLILEGLRARDIAMEERSRKKLRPGHRLRMVKKAKSEELATAAASKARSIE